MRWRDRPNPYIWPKMIPTLRLSNIDDRARVQALLRRLRLDPRDVVLGAQADVASVQQVLADVARRGDEAIVELARKYDDPNFAAGQIRVAPEEMQAAHGRVGPELLTALRRSIAQVREYQSHV